MKCASPSSWSWRLAAPLRCQGPFIYLKYASGSQRVKEGSAVAHPDLAAVWGWGMEVPGTS